MRSSDESGGGLAAQLRLINPGDTIYVLAEGLPNNPFPVTLFSVTDSVLIAGSLTPIHSAPAGSRIVFNLDEVTAVITT